MRAFSKISKEWWDYTTLDRAILDDAAKITIDTLKDYERPGFKINIYDTLQEFYCAEALEYIKAWKEATPSRPAGICGPIGPTEQLPLVAQMVNAFGISLKNCHFWGMDEWIVDGKAAGLDFRWDLPKPTWISASTVSIRNSVCRRKTCTFQPKIRRNTPRPMMNSAALPCRADRAKPSTGRSTTP